MEIPDELLPALGGYAVRCEGHRHTVGFISPGLEQPRHWHSFAPCGECPCPAGGPHDWGVLEESGTGRTWAGCENCGASMPREEE